MTESYRRQELTSQTRPKDIHSLFERTVPHSLIDCISDLLRYDPQMRLTSHQCLDHPYLLETSLRNNPPPPSSDPSITVPLSSTAKSQERAPVWPTAPTTISPRPLPLPPLTHPSTDLLFPPYMLDASSSHRTPFYSGSDTSTSLTSSPLSRNRNPSPIHQHPPEVSAWDDAEVMAPARPGDADWNHPMDLSSPIEEREDHIPVSGQVMDIQTSPMAQEYPARPRIEPDPIHERANETGLPQGTKFGKFGALTFGKKPSKWGLGMFGNGDKAQQNVLPPVDEMPVAPSLTSTPSLKRTQSSSTDSRSLSDFSPTIEPQPVDAKQVQKEAERVHREAERQRRALALKAQRDQARAVMQKRNQMLLTSNNELLEWKWQHTGIHANGQSRTNLHDSHPKGKKVSAGSIRKNPGNVANGIGSTSVNAPVGSFVMQGDNSSGESRRDSERVPKARRREFDDDHSMSSSDVHSVSQVSSKSFATVDSDPGPRARQRPSLFGLSRMTSTSSLHASFDEFSPSSRSSNSFSLEQQLANDFHNHASVDSSSPMPGSVSPPPMQILSISPSLSPSPSLIHHLNDNNRPPSQLPNFISNSPIPQHPSHMNPTGPPSPYEFGRQPHTMSPTSYGHPPSPGYAPKSAINPIFKVVSRHELHFFFDPLTFLSSVTASIISF